MQDELAYYVAFHGNDRTLAKVPVKKQEEWLAKNTSATEITKEQYDKLLREIKSETVIS